MPELPPLPQPVREAQPAGGRGPKPAAAKPAAKVDAVPDAIAGLKAEEPAKSRRALGVLSRTPRDARADDIAPLLEPYLAADSRDIPFALPAVKVWGNRTNIESLRRIRDAKNGYSQAAAEAIAEIEARP